MKVRSAIDVAYGSPLIIDEIDLPPPRPDQLIVKLFSSGLCHTQLHWLQNQSGSRPRISGHEATGVVTDLGSDVTHVKEGDHVIVTWTPRLSLWDTPSHPGVESHFAVSRCILAVFTPGLKLCLSTMRMLCPLPKQILLTLAVLSVALS
jgi:threonine dehydrogenase-like Zn-dependent dehydrogenase